jgi:phosphonoacetate hydrolase
LDSVHLVPSPDRDVSARVTPGAPAAPAARAAIREAALGVLLDPQLADVVDVVAWRDGGYVMVANAAGSARACVDQPGAEFDLLSGAAPIGCQDPLHGVPLAAALADPSPPNERNSYPDAARRLASAFADRSRSPDLHVIHTPRHYWPERGGHLGEHGSLDAGQSRAPLLISGAGVLVAGILPRSARVIDVGPTLAHASGRAPEATDGWQGAALADLIEPGADLVLGLLWDGVNSNDLLQLAADGTLPSVARLLEQGCALAGGAIAEFPSVTLVNHTSALCAVGPGRHGIVGNVFYDRATATRYLANDISTWHHACDLLRPGVRTVFEVCDGMATACVNEPIDRGAGYSTFELIRQAGPSDGARGMRSALPPAGDDRYATAEFVASDPDYAWSTQVDAFGLEQVVQQLSAAAPPALLWWNTTLTDTGHHGGGPYSLQARAALADTDRRLGVVIDLLERQGRIERTAFLLTGDHGSEGADPACRGDWDDALAAAGIAVRDEGYGSLYF